MGYCSSTRVSWYLLVEPRKRERILGIAARESIEEQIDEERCRTPWTELGSYILRNASEEMEGLRDVLKEVVIGYRKTGLKNRINDATT